MPTKRCRSCLRFGRRKLLDPAPPRLVNTASIERPVFIEINPAGVLRLAAPILYAWPSRAALGRGTTSNDTATHGQHRRYRLLSRRIPSSRCQSNRQIWPGGTFVSSQLGLSLSAVDLPVHGLVEPDGIEPTTSCLQSRRSPN